MRNSMSRGLALTATLLCVVLFQNCGKGFAPLTVNEESESSINPPPPNQPPSATCNVGFIQIGSTCFEFHTPQALKIGGATVPFISFEAEEGTYRGQLLVKSTVFGTFSSEASGRQAVRLNTAGDFVEIVATKPANSIVLRYAIPDSVDGQGLNTTLSLYVDGVKIRTLELTSRYSWSYGGDQGTSNDPTVGNSHHFFDEVHTILPQLAPGARLRVQKDAGDTATYYIVDLIDLEQVAPPRIKPAQYLSITDPQCGATPAAMNATDDDRPAIQRCVELVRTSNGSYAGVWIPEGIFHSTTSAINTRGMQIRGAGMWYSAISGYFSRFYCDTGLCQYSDFSIAGETTQRVDTESDNGFVGPHTNGALIERVWVEHTKNGAWIGTRTLGGANGVIVRDSRFRNLFADGVSLTGGSINSVIENNHLRNTGDDAIAIWSRNSDPVAATNNRISRNTVQIPWRANCFAIYGGGDNQLNDNACADTVVYPGILVANQTFGSEPIKPFSGTTTIARNQLYRTGGVANGLQHGALKIYANHGPVSGVSVVDNRLYDSTFSAVQILGPGMVSGQFTNTTISGSGPTPIIVTAPGGIQVR